MSENRKYHKKELYGDPVETEEMISDDALVIKAALRLISMRHLLKKVIKPPQKQHAKRRGLIDYECLPTDQLELLLEVERGEKRERIKAVLDKRNM